MVEGRGRKPSGERRPGTRTRARERALQALYQVDLAASDPADALAHAIDSEGDPARAGAADYASRLVQGVTAHREAIDAQIEALSHHWRVARMARVDRNVLRLAVFELMHEPEVPRKVAINEAIELAKKYGSEDSAAFINGILDKIAGRGGERGGA